MAEPPPRSPQPPTAGGVTPQVALIVSGVATVAVYQLPLGRYLLYPLMLLHTLVHELGHGGAAILAGGSFESFEMWANGSGVARHVGGGGRLAAAFVSAGGLVGPAVGAAVLFALARRPLTARIGLGVLGGLLALALVTVVGNLFAALVVGGYALLALAVAIKARPHVAQLVAAFGAVQLALSVWSRSGYLFAEYADTGEGRLRSDVGQMADALWLPYWFWGAACGALSLVIVAGGIYAFLRAERRARAPGG